MPTQLKQFIKVPAGEYRDLLEKKAKYEQLREMLTEDIFLSPPTRSRNEVIKALKNNGKYNSEFLKSLEQGLKRSSYFEKK